MFAEVEGPPAAVEAFLRALARDAPPLARIERITTAAMRPDGTASFSIAPSEAGRPRRTLVSADTATCADCLAELADPADRRFGYPFINCTNCGPRFTIVRDVPYDRPLTTMAGVRDVRPVRRGVPRPGGPPFPRPADLLPGVRSPAGPARPGRDGPARPAAARPRRTCCGRARCWP